MNAAERATLTELAGLAARCLDVPRPQVPPTLASPHAPVSGDLKTTECLPAPEIFRPVSEWFCGELHLNLPPLGNVPVNVVFGMMI